ncbi:MAG: hypothetical protein ACOY4M_08320 [Pseudomonadota bacterium]
MEIFLVALKCVLWMFAAFVVIVFLLVLWRNGVEAEREEVVKRLEDDHNSASIAETEERMALLYKAKMYSHGSEECERIMRQYLKLEKLHDKKWNERVRRIVDAEVPIDLDEEMKKRGW